MILIQVDRSEQEGIKNDEVRRSARIEQQQILYFILFEKDRTTK